MTASVNGVLKNETDVCTLLKCPSKISCNSHQLVDGGYKFPSAVTVKVFLNVTPCSGGGDIPTFVRNVGKFLSDASQLQITGRR